MGNINWINGSGSGEPMAGRNHPVLPDIVNRPLRTVLEMSGLDPDGNFPGFALSGSAGGSISASYALTASYAANGGGSSVSASWALTSSYAQTVGLVNAGQIVGVSGSVINPNVIISSSYALTASYALNGGGNSISSSFAATASQVNVGGYAVGLHSSSKAFTVFDVDANVERFSIHKTSGNVLTSQSLGIGGTPLFYDSIVAFPVSSSTGIRTLDVFGNPSGTFFGGLVTGGVAMLRLFPDGPVSPFNGNAYSIMAVSNRYLGGSGSAVGGGNLSIWSQRYTTPIFQMDEAGRIALGLSADELNIYDTASLFLRSDVGTTALLIMATSPTQDIVKFINLAGNIRARINSLFNWVGNVEGSASILTPSPVVSISGSYTASAADGIIMINPGVATASVYLPGVAANSGISLMIRKISSSLFPVVIVPSGSNTIDGLTGIQLTSQRATVVLTSNGSNEWIGGSGSLASNASSSYATTASYATLAQNVLGSITSASYALTSSFATRAISASWAPSTTSAISSSYALTASYALNGGSGGGSFVPLAGNTTMTGPITMSFGSDTGLEKLVFTAGATKQFRIGANSDVGAFTGNATYAGGAGWVSDDGTYSSFAIMNHIGNGQIEFRVSAGTGAGPQTITWLKPLTIDQNGFVSFPLTTIITVAGPINSTAPVTASAFAGNGAALTGVISASYALNGGSGGGVGGAGSLGHIAKFSAAGTLTSSIMSESVGVVTVKGALNVLGGVVAVSYIGTGSNIVGVVSASYSTTSSFATVAQNVLGSITSASYALVAQTVLGGIATASYNVMPRLTQTFTASSQAANAIYTGSLVLGAEFICYAVSASSDSRLRIYNNQANLFADISRSLGTTPSASSGVLLDVAFIGTQKVIGLSPAILGYNFETVPTDNIPWAITNLGAGASAVTCSITYKRN